MRKKQSITDTCDLLSAQEQEIWSKLEADPNNKALLKEDLKILHKMDALLAIKRKDIRNAKKELKKIRRKLRESPDNEDLIMQEANLRQWVE